jgi:hypothetical protein
MLKDYDVRKTQRLDLGGKPSRPSILDDGTVSIVELLKGTWTSEAQGWNLIALPTSAPKQFRLLMNQYGETLNFNRFADLNVPNRGVTSVGNEGTDQKVDAIAYEQIVHQRAVDDFPPSGLKAANGDGIHHEPGFFLQLLNHVVTGHTEEDGKPDGPDEKLKIARQASIPHGNSVLAMGTMETFSGPPKIEEEDATPERIDEEDFNINPYLKPYKHFQDNPFFGNVPNTVAGFPGFSPKNANAILQFANPGGRVKETTHLHFDTKYRNAQLTTIPISNVPFVVREANVTEMHADFWIMELHKPNESADPEFVMQYSQTVYLEFFNATDGSGKLIRWPHVSINTLRRS